MLFASSFYIFSLFISYIDCTRYRIPNNLLISLLIFLITFGFLEDKISYYSFAVSLLILVFFVIILVVMPRMILGGGDIKYMMVIAIYLPPLEFPLFLLFCGLFQMIFLIYRQKIKKRRVTPMAPTMLMAVLVAELLIHFGVYQPI